MTPRHPGVAARWPIIVAGRVRPFFDYKHLDVKLRLRIITKRHSRGYYFRPRDDDDAEAIAWIEKLAARYGELRWEYYRWIKVSKKDKEGR